jgi:aryl-alcohol dehydrogenase-like predicted oxidoreductase
MRSAVVKGPGIRLSRLGFGCVSLSTHQRSRDALRLLHEAFDAGITHFDVARLYGFGRAEGILGGFLRTVPRERITVTTKFGLEPPAGLAGRPSLVRIGKNVVRSVPGLRSIALRTLRTLTPPHRYSMQHAATSLETSLRELGSDYVDLFLMHEAQLADASAPDLLDYLEREVRAGRIRAYGVATHTTQLGSNLASFPQGHAVFQFNNAALDAEIASLTGTTDKMLITHSALAPVKLIRKATARCTALVREWSAKIGADLAAEQIVTQLLLDYALQSNERGVVLFSTMRGEHLRQNVQRALGGQHSSEQIVHFREYCRRLIGQMAA